MKLKESECKQFFSLWFGLVYGVNARHGYAADFKLPVYKGEICTSKVEQIREHIWDNPRLIDEYISDNKQALTEEDIQILTSWRNNFIHDRFIVYKHLSAYSVFMPADNPKKLYGVCGTEFSIKEMLEDPVPLMVDVVLLPFKGKIVTDGFFTMYTITLGKDAQKSLRTAYNEAKETSGITEAFGEGADTSDNNENYSKPDKQYQSLKQSAVPKAVAERYNEIAPLIESFADTRLNAEYKDICLRALQKLSRKRPTPISGGKAQTWACGIVYAIGQINYIFDKTQPIHLTAADITNYFGISKNTAAAKAAQIRKLLDLSVLNTEFLLENIIDNNPMIWNLCVNGLVVDIRSMPREVQLDAFYRGLIPYVPMDKKK